MGVLSSARERCQHRIVGAVGALTGVCSKGRGRTEEGDMKPARKPWELLVWEVTREHVVTAGDFLVESGVEGGKACVMEAPACAKAQRQDPWMSAEC